MLLLRNCYLLIAMCLCWCSFRLLEPFDLSRLTSVFFWLYARPSYRVLRLLSAHPETTCGSKVKIFFRRCCDICLIFVGGVFFWTFHSLNPVPVLFALIIFVCHNILQHLPCIVHRLIPTIRLQIYCKSMEIIKRKTLRGHSFSSSFLFPAPSL